MTTAELLDLLREAQRYVASHDCNSRCNCVAAYDLQRLFERIKAAIAERQDSAKGVVEWSEPEGWMQVSRANLPGRRLRVAVFSKHEWEWETVCRGRCATEAEARRAATAAARGMR